MIRRLFAGFVVNVMLLTLFFSGNSFAGPAPKWSFDKIHTSITFKIWHLMTPVYGKFDDFNIDLKFDPDNLNESSIKLSIQAASINTGWEPRDTHLNTQDWFDTSRYPVITFTSSQITRTDEDRYIAKGKLKIRDVEKDVELPFKLLGIKKITKDMKPMFGDNDEVASFEITNYLLNRKDYNVGTGTSTPGEAALTYRDVVGSSVNISIALEVYRKTK